VIIARADIADQQPVTRGIARSPTRAGVPLACHWNLDVIIRFRVAPRRARLRLRAPTENQHAASAGFYAFAGCRHFTYSCQLAKAVMPALSPLLASEPFHPIQEMGLLRSGVR
jgi:hypothetical protein